MTRIPFPQSHYLLFVTPFFQRNETHRIQPRIQPPPPPTQKTCFNPPLPVPISPTKPPLTNQPHLHHISKLPSPLQHHPNPPPNHSHPQTPSTARSKTTGWSPLPQLRLRTNASSTETNARDASIGSCSACGLWMPSRRLEAPVVYRCLAGSGVGGA